MFILLADFHKTFKKSVKLTFNSIQWIFKNILFLFKNYIYIYILHFQIIEIVCVCMICLITHTKYLTKS